MTNYENIKSMSVDRLAEAIVNIPNCEACPIVNKCRLFDKDWSCMIAVTNWLNSEVENDDE